MEAGRMCEEIDCCEWGDYNNEETYCLSCDITFIPKDEHDKDTQKIYDWYYFGKDDIDEGDICFKCVKKLFISHKKATSV